MPLDEPPASPRSPRRWSRRQRGPPEAPAQGTMKGKPRARELLGETLRTPSGSRRARLPAGGAQEGRTPLGCSSGVFPLPLRLTLLREVLGAQLGAPKSRGRRGAGAWRKLTQSCAHCSSPKTKTTCNSKEASDPVSQSAQKDVTSPVFSSCKSSPRGDISEAPAAPTQPSAHIQASHSPPGTSMASSGATCWVCVPQPKPCPSQPLNPGRRAVPSDLLGTKQPEQTSGPGLSCPRSSGSS